MKRTELKRKTPMSRGTHQLARTSIKKKAPKKRAGHDKAMLVACRGQRCYLRVPYLCCSYDGDPTVVPCHSNQSKHGKGGAIKARDEYSVPGCYQCHAWLDAGPAPRAEKDAAWDAAYVEWQVDRVGKQQATL